MRLELVEELGRIDDCRVSTPVHAFDNVGYSGEHNWVRGHMPVLKAPEHVCYDSPLSRFALFGDNKEGGIE